MEYVCHTTSPENAQKIFECGILLSALKARKLTVEELMVESRNTANDTADYLDTSCWLGATVRLVTDW